MNKDSCSVMQNQCDIEWKLLVKHILKSWKIVVLIAIVCGLISFGYSSFGIPKVFQSSGSIYVEPKINTNGEVDYYSGDAIDRMTKVFVYEIKSDEILEEVVKRMDSDITVNEIRNSLTVENLEDNNIISITASFRNPEQAKLIVDNVINVFFDNVKSRIKTEEIEIITRPTSSNIHTSPNIRKNTALGVFFGLFLSIALLILKFVFNKKIKSVLDAETSLGIPVLGSIPNLIKEFDKQIKCDNVEALRNIRIGLDYAANCNDRKIINFVGATQQDQNLRIAAALAYSYTYKYEKVLLINCDTCELEITDNKSTLKRMSLCDIFHGEKFYDFDNSLYEYEANNVKGNLYILNLNDFLNKEIEVFETDEFKEFLNASCENFGKIIISSSPLEKSLNCIPVSNLSEGTIFNVSVKNTDKTVVIDAINKLKNNGINLLGSILIDMDNE